MVFSARIIKTGLILLLFTFLFHTFAPLTQAQGNGSLPYYPPTTQSRPENLSPDVQYNQHVKAQTAFMDVMAALMCQLVGIDPLTPDRACLSYDPSTGKIGYAKFDQNQMRVGGALGAMAGLIGSTYQLPVHTSDYTAYLASNFGISKPAYAQEGTGFVVLRPLLNLWTKLRDLSYLAFVVIFVLIGLGIMLRVKIDPRTVMAIQNQIPKIIVSILLITFSYAIAGALVDIMWVTTYLGINVISSAAPNPGCSNPDAVATAATNNLFNNPIQYVGALLKIDGCDIDYGFKELSYDVGQTVGDVLISILTSLFGGDGSSTCQTGSSWSAQTWMDCVGDVIFNFFSFLIGLVATLIILIAIFAQLFRVWFSLLRSFIYVLMYTILSPGWILLGLIPGTKNFGFEQWLRQIVSALTVFPVTAFLFLLAVVVANDPIINNPQESFLPPLIGNPSIQNNIGMLVALGIILISPEVINMMRNAFRATQSKYTGAITTGAGIGAGIAGGVMSKAFNPLVGVNSAGMPTGPLSYYGYQAMGNLLRSRGPARLVNSRWFNQSTMGKMTSIEQPTSGDTKKDFNIPQSETPATPPANESTPQGSDDSGNPPSSGGPVT